MKVTVVLSRDSKLIYESLECFPVDVMVMRKSINVSKHIFPYTFVETSMLLFKYTRIHSWQSGGIDRRWPWAHTD